MFVAVNCALDMEEGAKPPWIQTAKELADNDGGLRKAVVWRNATQRPGGSNTLPILIGPVVAQVGDAPLQRYGWAKKAKIHTCFASWWHSN